jgi:S1-C subfamily serine protease
MSEGFCFKENKRKALAITFEKEGLTASPSIFVVENLNQKSKTNLLIGDKVIKAEGRNVTSVSDLKILAFHYGQIGTVKINLEIIRQGKSLTLSEPLAELSNGAHGPDSLEALQKKYY